MVFFSQVNKVFNSLYGIMYFLPVLKFQLLKLVIRGFVKPSVRISVGFRQTQNYVNYMEMRACLHETHKSFMSSPPQMIYVHSCDIQGVDIINISNKAGFNNENKLFLTVVQLRDIYPYNTAF